MQDHLKLAILARDACFWIVIGKFCDYSVYIKYFADYSSKVVFVVMCFICMILLC